MRTAPTRLKLKRWAAELERRGNRLVQRRRWPTLLGVATLVVLLIILGVQLWQAADLNWWGAAVAVGGALIFGALDTYTGLDADRRLVERPAPLRKLILGDGATEVSRTAWIGFQSARVAGLLTIVVGFALTLITAVEALDEANERMEDLLHVREQLQEVQDIPVIRDALRERRRLIRSTDKDSESLGAPNDISAPAQLPLSRHPDTTDIRGDRAP